MQSHELKALLSLIETPQIRAFVEGMVDNARDKTMPAWRTGHIEATVYFADRLCAAYHTTAMERDAVLAGCLLQDFPGNSLLEPAGALLDAGALVLSCLASGKTDCPGIFPADFGLAEQVFSSWHLFLRVAGPRGISIWST